MKTLFEHKFNVGDKAYAITDPLTYLVEPVTIVEIIHYVSEGKTWYKTDPDDFISEDYCFHTEAEATEFANKHFK